MIDAATARYAASSRRRELPPTCRLRLVRGSASEPATQAVAVAQPDSVPAAANVFRREGKMWLVRYAGGRDNRHPRSRGMAYLHILLTQSGVAVPALNMAVQVSGNARAYSLGTADEAADPQALEAYHLRLQELREEVEDAAEAGVDRRREAAEEEIEQIATHLRTVGLRPCGCSPPPGPWGHHLGGAVRPGGPAAGRTPRRSRSTRPGGW